MEKHFKVELKKLREKMKLALEERDKWCDEFKNLENKLEEYKINFNTQISRIVVEKCHEIVKDMPKTSRSKLKNCFYNFQFYNISVANEIF